MSSKKKSDFLLMILCNGRPDNVKTVNTLNTFGYDEDWVIVCDDMDKTLDGYKERFGDRVQVFDKKKTAEMIDFADNFGGLNCAVVARNACYDIAEKLGYEYFLVFDDDYTYFDYRFNENYDYITSNKKIGSLYKVWQSYLRWMKCDERIYSVCFAQGGDFIGGGTGYFGKKIRTKRKGMNSWFSSTKRRMIYNCRMNDDINTAIRYNIIGKIVITVGNTCLMQPPTQAVKGGMTDIYVESGTYVKSFYSVMISPSSVKIALMGNKYKRLHHNVRWKHTAPLIVAEKYKKGI